MNEQRQNKRAVYPNVVRVKSASVGDFVDEQGSNLSTGGMFVTSDNPLPQGALLRIEFQLEEGDPMIHGVARVIWKRDVEGTHDGSTAGMGIKFVKLSEEHRALVTEYVGSHPEAISGRPPATSEDRSDEAQEEAEAEESEQSDGASEDAAADEQEAGESAAETEADDIEAASDTGETEGEADQQGRKKRTKKERREDARKQKTDRKRSRKQEAQQRVAATSGRRERTPDPGSRQELEPAPKTSGPATLPLIIGLVVLVGIAVAYFMTR